MSKEKFHIRLRRLREDRKLTVKDVASRIGVPDSSYREWEYGRAITGEPYLEIAKAFGIGVHELLSGMKPKNEDVLQELKLVRRHLDALETKLESFF